MYDIHATEDGELRQRLTGGYPSVLEALKYVPGRYTRPCAIVRSDGAWAFVSLLREYLVRHQFGPQPTAEAALSAWREMDEAGLVHYEDARIEREREVWS